MKEALCKAFCDQLSVRAVPAGLAVSTAFTLSSGEPLGFYVIGPDQIGRYRLEDDGTTLPMIEAAGIDLDSQTRSEALAELFAEYGAVHNGEAGELSTPPLTEEQIPGRALLFAALLLRLQDIALLTPERVASTFREDATKAIKAVIADHATIYENQAPAAGIDFPADLVIEAPHRPPVAIFLAMSEQRVLEAVAAHMSITYEAKVDCSVIALLDTDTTISRRVRRHASNRLTAMPIFDGDETAAVQRIAQEVLGRGTRTVH